MSQTKAQLVDAVDGSIVAADLAADCVTTDKVANSAITDAKISGLTSSKLTGALPAISGASLTELPASGKATNLVINGSMTVAQRAEAIPATSSTTNGYGSVDRFKVSYSGTDESPTQERVDVASGTTPYTLGFRKALRVTNGNQTSGAGADDFITINHRVESQDVAQSGWNYLSSSSNITFSFWVKSSVAQNFYFRATTSDGTSQNYPMETGSLSAATWTKITKTIPGNSNLTFENDTGIGLEFDFALFLGTDYTGSVTLNQWAAFSASTMVPDSTSTWYTTNDATFEITGVQLEVGDSATDFEHLTFAETLTKCERYFQQVHTGIWGMITNTSGRCAWVYDLRPIMRATPTTTATTAQYRYGNQVDQSRTISSISSITGGYSDNKSITFQPNGSASSGTTTLTWFYMEPIDGQNHAFFEFSAEL